MIYQEERHKSFMEITYRPRNRQTEFPGIQVRSGSADFRRLTSRGHKGDEIFRRRTGQYGIGRGEDVCITADRLDHPVGRFGDLRWRAVAQQRQVEIPFGMPFLLC